MIFSTLKGRHFECFLKELMVNLYFCCAKFWSKNIVFKI